MAQTAERSRLASCQHAAATAAHPPAASREEDHEALCTQRAVQRAQHEGYHDAHVEEGIVQVILQGRAGCGAPRQLSDCSCRWAIRDAGERPTKAWRRALSPTLRCASCHTLGQVWGGGVTALRRSVSTRIAAAGPTRACRRPPTPKCCSGWSRAARRFHK